MLLNLSSCRVSVFGVKVWLRKDITPKDKETKRKKKTKTRKKDATRKHEMTKSPKRHKNETEKQIGELTTSEKTKKEKDAKVKEENSN